MCSRAGRGFCIGKSALLAAVARVIGIPARLGYADVRNHLTSKRLYGDGKATPSSGTPTPSFMFDGHWVKCDAGLRQRSVRARPDQAARLRRPSTTVAVPSVRSGRAAAHGISAGPRHLSSTCPSTPFRPISRRSIRSLLPQARPPQASATRSPPDRPPAAPAPNVMITKLAISGYRSLRDVRSDLARSTW